MWLVKKPEISEATKLEHMGLEELLTYMIRYGKPRISYLDKGWYCKVEMNTNTKGTQFDVASDFDQPTPLQAARMCHERIIGAMKALGV
jgi:hypothetical protein